MSHPLIKWHKNDIFIMLWWMRSFSKIMFLKMKLSIIMHAQGIYWTPVLVLHNTELTMIVGRNVIHLWWQDSQYCGSCYIDYRVCMESVNFTEWDFTVCVCVCGMLWLVCMCSGAHNATSLMLWEVPGDYNMHLKQQHIQLIFTFSNIVDLG